MHEAHCPTYVQGIITDMMDDCQEGIGWVLQNIQGFGGDPSRVYIMGQSCGGHLAALTLQKQYELWGTERIKAANRRSRSASAWDPTSIKVCAIDLCCAWHRSRTVTVTERTRSFCCESFSRIGCTILQCTHSSCSAPLIVGVQSNARLVWTVRFIMILIIL